MTCAQINVAALVHNCRVLRKALGARGLFAVIKADAYGHGRDIVAAALADAVDGLCVFALADAVALRARAVRVPLLVMGGCANVAQVEAAHACNAWPVVCTPLQVQAIVTARHKPARVFVKARIGMHRLGLPTSEVIVAVANLRDCGCANLALLHHYAAADIAGGIDEQAQVMRELATQCSLPFSASNSAATLLGDDLGEEFARCGIAVYGCSPAYQRGVTAANLNLQPVMLLLSEVIAVQSVAVNSTVGYGSRWRALRDTTIAVVACGYAYGYPRAAPDGTPVFLGGRRVPLAGRVSMEMLTVEVADGTVAIGDRVELWGTNVSADEVATSVGTIGYELLVGLPGSVSRQVSDNGTTHG